MTDFRFQNRRGAFTLIELLVVVSIIALLVAILLPSLTKAREQARWAKCLGNLHAMSLATVTYTTDYNGTLPGPLHPAVTREVHNFGELPDDWTSAVGPEDKQKSLVWLLRPYFQSGGNFNVESRVAYEVSKCPTAPLISPDEDFYNKPGETKKVLCRPYSYAVNSWGPQYTYPPLEPVDAPYGWYHTDPPLYFGVWYYLDDDFEEARFPQGMWKPKNIERIKFASAEYSVADAWYRRVAQATRRGSSFKREFLGTFPSENSGSPLPSAPYHLTDLARVRSTRNQPTGQGILPKIEFKGRTNLAYFDGHAAGFRGRWQETGEGGTVNPFWAAHGGDH
jgi:prepilin-type N-terminal cleavage/methylation domain-containing protein/prepilin-type processing-associated H-X9-DG protein